MVLSSLLIEEDTFLNTEILLYLSSCIDDCLSENMVALTATAVIKEVAGVEVENVVKVKVAMKELWV